MCLIPVDYLSVSTGEAVSPGKSLTAFCLGVLLLSLLAVSFDRHEDFAYHATCPICQIARTLSAAAKASAVTVCTQTCPVNPDVNFLAHQAFSPRLLTSLKEHWFEAGARKDFAEIVTYSASCRAPPAAELSHHSFI